MSDKLIIEIRKAGFVNKGAELMLYAVLQRLRREYPNALFVMAPIYSGLHGSENFEAYYKQAELALLPKAWLHRYGFYWGDLVALVPKIIRQLYGWVLDKEVDVVIDAAGFSYSDQWGEDSSLELAKSSQRWRKQGSAVIMLPQAFGPFTSKNNNNSIAAAVKNSDLIFAREDISYKYLIDAVGERTNIKMAPDFTNLVEGVIPEYFDSLKYRYCIVPNYRMIDKTSQSKSDVYLPFMINCVKYLIEKGASPFLLVHEGEKDLILAQKICDAVNGECPVLVEKHPLKIKGIIGCCDGTIGSRFHGLVSALSQGVPSLATGWSHKYEMLFKEYDFREGMLDVMSSEVDLRKKIDLITNPDTRNKIHLRLIERSEFLKQKSEEMWEMVIGVIESNQRVKAKKGGNGASG